MPRVSADHLAARREQIVQASMICFSANGFHATTMAHVIAESGLSAGAVYRYFRSKEELVGAIAQRVVDVAGRSLAELLEDDAAPTPIMVLRHLLLDIYRTTTTESTELRRLALQVWAEAQRNDQIMATVREGQFAIRGYFEEAARRARDHGHLPADADPHLVAQALVSLMIGWVVQSLTLGDVDPPENYLRGVEALLTPGLGTPA